MYNYFTPVFKKWRVIPICYNGENVVATGAQPGECGGAALAQHRVEAVCARRREHARRAAAAPQPQQHPQRVIVLDAKGAKRLSSIFRPQATSIKRCTVCFKKR